MTDSALICVPPDRTAVLWPHVREMIEAGLAAGDEVLPDGLLERLADGRVLLWIAVVDERIVAAMLTALLPRKSGLVCKMLATGGTDFDIWKGWHVRIEEYARAENCVKVESECRPGFSRVLDGYRTVRHVIEKRL
ncbi:MAG: hypothetical protein WC670_19365 [Pseudolabrys sp.]|jgi:hypothetical protein